MPVEPVTRPNAEAFASLLGGRIVGVTYYFLPRADAGLYEGGHPGLDEDLVAVDLAFADRPSVIVTWAMRGEIEGLALTDRVPYTTVARKMDATDREGWRWARDATVTGVGAAWHVSGERCPESLCALRLAFGADLVVIALGTATPKLSYRPDELVVIFSSELVGGFQFEHQTGSPRWRLPGSVLMTTVAHLVCRLRSGWRRVCWGRCHRLLRLFPTRPVCSLWRSPLALR